MKSFSKVFIQQQIKPMVATIKSNDSVVEFVGSEQHQPLLTS